jgi:prophage tail gpP-like protein
MNDINQDGSVIVGDVDEAVRRVSRNKTKLSMSTRSHVRDLLSSADCLPRLLL